VKTPADLLADAGLALFGAGYRRPLADALGVRDDTLRHWLSGKNDIPFGVLENALSFLAASETLNANARRDLAAYLRSQRQRAERPARGATSQPADAPGHDGEPT
jgi:hypothetical protein